MKNLKDILEGLFDKGLASNDNISYDDLIKRLGSKYINETFDVIFDIGDKYKLTTLNEFMKTEYVYHEHPNYSRKKGICVIFLKSTKNKTRAIISFAAKTTGCFKTTTHGDFWIDSGWDFWGTNDSKVGKEYLYEHLKEDNFDEYSVMTNKNLAIVLLQKLATTTFRGFRD